MKETETKHSCGSAAGVLLVLLSIVIAIVYFKMSADDTLEEQGKQKSAKQLPIAVPNTSSTGEMVLEDFEDSVVSPETIGADTRSAMEAGDEDGYWDGWYDGAETGQRSRYDENSNFASSQDRKIYSESYREGYDKGFAESMQRKNS